MTTHNPFPLPSIMSGTVTSDATLARWGVAAHVVFTDKPYGEHLSVYNANGIHTHTVSVTVQPGEHYKNCLYL